MTAWGFDCAQLERYGQAAHHGDASRDVFWQAAFPWCVHAIDLSVPPLSDAGHSADQRTARRLDLGPQGRRGALIDRLRKLRGVSGVVAEGLPCLCRRSASGVAASRHRFPLACQPFEHLGRSLFIRSSPAFAGRAAALPLFQGALASRLQLRNPGYKEI